MKTRTNQPIYKDDGTLLEDSDLGSKLYNHNLRLSLQGGSVWCDIYLNLITKDGTEITSSNINNFLDNYNNKKISACGSSSNSSVSHVNAIKYLTSSHYISIFGGNNNSVNAFVNTSSLTLIEDAVIEI